MSITVKLSPISATDELLLRHRVHFRGAVMSAVNSEKL